MTGKAWNSQSDSMRALSVARDNITAMPASRHGTLDYMACMSCEVLDSAKVFFLGELRGAL